MSTFEKFFSEDSILLDLKSMAAIKGGDGDPPPWPPFDDDDDDDDG